MTSAISISTLDDLFSLDKDMRFVLINALHCVSANFDKEKKHYEKVSGMPMKLEHMEISDDGTELDINSFFINKEQN